MEYYYFRILIMPFTKHLFRGYNEENVNEKHWQRFGLAAK